MARRKQDQVECVLEDSLAYMHKHLFKEPRTRGDVSKRKSSNRQTTVSVVKTTWNSFCKPAALALPLDCELKDMNKTIAEAYILANIHVMRMCELEQPIAPLDQSFFYGCLSAVSTAGRKKALISDVRLRGSVEVYDSWRATCTGYSAPNSHHLASGWHQNVSLQMVTNTRNSTTLNFARRLKRYLKHKYGLDGKESWDALVKITRAEYAGTDPLILEYRRKLPPQPGYGWREDYPHLVMPMQYEILKYFEAAQLTDARNKQLRLFTLVPMKQGFECSHLKMCTNGLHGLLKRAGVEVPTQACDWRDVAEKHWRELFNIDKFETANRTFAFEILTDGKAVSIVMRRPKPPAAKGTKHLSLDDYDEVWGLDPGRRAMFTACNEEDDFKMCSSKEFYEEAKYKQSNRTIKGWQDRSPFVKDAIAVCRARRLQTLTSSKLTFCFCYQGSMD